MEPIKIQVNVQVDFSEAMQNFIKGLMAPSDIIEAPKAALAQAPAANAVEPKPKPKPEPEPKPEPKPEPAPAPKPAEEPAVLDIDIEMVRAALTKKVNVHRAEIKAKLNELGSPSVTKLDPAKYREMYDFLEALS